MKHHCGNRLCSASQAVVATIDREEKVTAAIVPPSFRGEKTVGFSQYSPRRDATLYFSPTVLPPSVFEKKNVFGQAQSHTLCAPSHSILLLRF